MPYITTNTITRKGIDCPEDCLAATHEIVEHKDEYIVEPLSFATLWKDITGRAVVTEADIENIKALARFFGSGLAITRNNHTNSDEAKHVSADYYNRNR